MLAREGPAGLTSRAVTAEADCAKGVLHSHFADLDDFVAQLVLLRFEELAHAAAALPARAGTDTVSVNLTAVAALLLGSPGPALSALALTRPGATERIHAAWEQGDPGSAPSRARSRPTSRPSSASDGCPPPATAPPWPSP
ncbi:hypothetical protein AB0I77_19235 [Streptomyces sp. NPDC050619]|uniref:hypothetical protein n=1 Tax=Streptomyces sp. NPDC050619 TaxID=3157214 RepID=UPI0034431190